MAPVEARHDAQREIEEGSLYPHRPGPKGPVTICEDLDRCVVMAMALPRPKGDAGGIQAGPYTLWIGIR